MQSVTPCAVALRRLRRRPRGGRGAFTLLEILLVLALIGLLTGVLVTGANRMLDPGPETPTQAFWHMANAARRYALQHETEVRVSFDSTTSELVGRGMDGVDLPAVGVPGGAEIAFIPGLTPPATANNPNNQLTALFGASAAGGSGTVDYVTFYNDGTCSLFRVQISTNLATIGGDSQLIDVDPWTVAPSLTSATLEPEGAL